MKSDPGAVLHLLALHAEGHSPRPVRPLEPLASCLTEQCAALAERLAAGGMLALGRRVLSLAEHLAEAENPPLRVLVRVASTRALLHWVAGEVEPCLAELERARSLCAGEAAQEAATWFRRAFVLADASRPQEARQALDRGLELARKTDGRGVPKHLHDLLDLIFEVLAVAASEPAPAAR